MSKINYQLIDEKDVIFIDCFDTIIYRRCKPDLVISSWVDKLSQLYRIDSKILKKIWFATLKDANNKAADRDEVTFYTLCMELYHRILYIKEMEESCNDFYDACLSTMIEMEKRVVFVNSEMLQVIRYAKEHGKKLYCVSDFYLPQSAIEELFESLDVLKYFDGIYISSQEGKRKSTGRLYKYILESLNLDANKVLMLGDNKLSDYTMAVQHGIEAVWYQTKACKKNLQEDIFEELYQIYKGNNSANMPFANYSFSLYLFCRQLYVKMKQNHQHTVYFFAREGEFLKKLFDQYLSIQKENKIRTEYVYISRQSTFLPSLGALSEEKFDVLKKDYKNLSLKMFLANLKIYQEIISDTDIASKYDMDCKINDFFNSDVYHSLLREKRFEEIYESKRSQEQNAIKKYFEKLGITDDTQEVVVVDIGWKGSIQDNLFKIYQAQKKIVGYYYGITGKVDITAKNRKEGLVFTSMPYDNQYYHTYMINYRMLERVLYASHGSCLRYHNSDAVLDEYGTEEKELFDYVLPIQDKMFQQVCAITELVERNLYLEENVMQSLSTIQKIFCIDISKTRLRQMKYMDERQKMNFGDWGAGGSKQSVKDIARWVYHMNKLELLQKIVMVLYKYHLSFVGYMMKQIKIQLCIIRRLHE